MRGRGQRRRAQQQQQQRLEGERGARHAAHEAEPALQPRERLGGRVTRARAAEGRPSYCLQRCGDIGSVDSDGLYRILM